MYNVTILLDFYKRIYLLRLDAHLINNDILFPPIQILRMYCPTLESFNNGVVYLLFISGFFILQHDNKWVGETRSAVRVTISCILYEVHRYDQGVLGWVWIRFPSTTLLGVTWQLEAYNGIMLLHLVYEGCVV